MLTKILNYFLVKSFLRKNKPIVLEDELFFKTNQGLTSFDELSDNLREKLVSVNWQIQ